MTMGTRRVMKELGDALHFICSLEFWRMAVFWTLSLLISYCRLLFSPHIKSYARCSPAASPINNKPICIITGVISYLHFFPSSPPNKFAPNCSLFVCFTAFSSFCCRLHQGWVRRLLMLFQRKVSASSLIVEEIKSRNKDAHLKVFQVDISSFQSILNFKGCLQRWLLDSNMDSSIQLLINNAGILATSCRFTAEGYDQMMATNYIGAFCLTKLLLPLLRNSPVPSRIVNVTSFTHRNVFDMQVDKETVSGKWFLGAKRYPCARIYENSKLCLLLFSYELHRQLCLMEKPQVSVIAVDPGVVETNIMREVPSCLSHVALTVLKLLGLLQSPEQGISAILDAALAPPDISGLHFFGGKGRTLNSSALSHNTKLAQELWTTSCDLFSQSKVVVKETST
ncbi:Dehydrogenase/reductase SDR family member on chromosome X [Morella rubra]|uniref:Dehydrogenase/reductase SDR family member on chromosome X n=1 Tax=Morella rubra TaxID=262757 RepID=A0A6A1VK66_9ROSI|nr:Dehydrogenase/reductase SDR family member on chromosome X [Morella rubra]